MDDATSEIYSAFLVDEEGTMSSFQGLIDVVAEHGLPCALYTDRASHYFHTPEAKVAPLKPAQPGTGEPKAAEPKAAEPTKAASAGGGAAGPRAAGGAPGGGATRPGG